MQEEPQEIPDHDDSMPYEAYLDDWELADFRKLQRQYILTDYSHQNLVEIHKNQMKVKSNLHIRRKKLQELAIPEEKKTNDEIEAIMQNVRFQLGKAIPKQLNDPHIEEEVADNIRNITQRDNPTLYSQMVAGMRVSRNHRFTEAFCNLPRMPPKLIAPERQGYMVEFPPDDDALEENSHNIQQEEENHLAISLTAGLILQKKRDGDFRRNRGTAKAKRLKTTAMQNDTNFSGSQGRSNSSSNSNSEAEEAGLSMPPTFK